MFLCARNRCRERYFPDDDTVDIKDISNRFEVQYITKCGHSLCEKCLYMAIQSDERSYLCDQCGEKTTFSARAYTSIKAGNLSNSSRINRLNKDVPTEIPIDAYSFGLAFCEGKLTVSPVEIDPSTVEPPPTMEQSFKYSKEGIDQDNIKLKSLIPPAKRNKTIPLIATMHHAVATHAECGFSLKVLGNLERKLSKEFYQAKMRLREDFQHLHSLLQLEEMKGITKFEGIYKTRKEEFSQVERHLFSVRRSIADSFDLEHDTMEKLTKKRNKLKEFIPKPSRISWRNYEIADEFNYHLDDYLKTVIKDSLVLKNIEKATTLTVEVVDPEVSTHRQPLPLFRSPPHHIPQIPAPGSSSSSSELVTSLDERKKSTVTCIIKKEKEGETRYPNANSSYFKCTRLLLLFIILNWINTGAMASTNTSICFNMTQEKNFNFSLNNLNSTLVEKYSWDNMSNIIAILDKLPAWVRTLLKVGLGGVTTHYVAGQFQSPKDEAYIKINETLNLSFDIDGTVLNSEILGSVKLTVELTGMPELKLGLKDGVLSSSTDIGITKAVDLEEMKFHQSVQMSRLFDGGIISFKPPNGEFELISYRLSTDVKPLISITGQILIDNLNGYRYSISINSEFETELIAFNVEIAISIAHDSYSPKFETSIGSVKYAPEQGVIIWSIKSLNGQEEYSLLANHRIKEASDIEHRLNKIHMVKVKFNIPHFAVSGILVRYLTIYETSDEVLTYSNYRTQSGIYEYQLKPKLARFLQ